MVSDERLERPPNPFASDEALRREYGSAANYAQAERDAQRGDREAVAWLQRRLEWLERRHELHNSCDR